MQYLYVLYYIYSTVYSTVYSVVYSTVYNTVYSTVYSTVHSTVYSIVYNTVYSIVYSTVYSTVYNIVYSTVSSGAYPWMWGQFIYSVELKLASHWVLNVRLSHLAADLRRRHCQVGNLAGAAHLLNDNASVLIWTQWELKLHADQKAKSLLDSFSTKTHCEIMLYWSCRFEKFPARGVRKLPNG